MFLDWCHHLIGQGTKGVHLLGRRKIGPAHARARVTARATDACAALTQREPKESLVKTPGAVHTLGGLHAGDVLHELGG